MGLTLDRAQRRARVVAYFSERPRATVRDAERDLGIPKSTVQRDRDAAIAETVGRAADVYIAAMVGRNEAIVEAFMPLALRRGSVQHAQAVLAADKRTAELLGLDAPKRAELTGKDGGPIQHELTLLRAAIERHAHREGLTVEDVMAEVPGILAEGRE